MVKKLPSGDVPESNDSEDPNRFAGYFESAEQYEALGDSIELQIRQLKAEISKELQDEFARLEYLLSQRELELKKKELELEQRERDVTMREQRIARLEAIELTPSPKQYDQGEESLEDVLDEEEFERLTEGNERAPYTRRPEAQVPGKDYIPNPEGKGGLPGSKLSNSIVIDRGVYQGKNRINLENGNSLVWNKQTKMYDDEFIPGDDPVMNKNRGLKFTYYAVEAAYLEQGYDNPNYGNFYSQTLLGKQVWYEFTPRNRKDDGLGAKYGGRVPLEILDRMLNEAINTRLFTGDGQFIENQDYRRAYKNYRLKYERGTYYKTKAGDLYSILEPGSQVYETKGNPPSYRTDGNMKSPTYGQRVEQSTEQKNRWYSFSGGKSKSKGRKGKK
jgi:hypothetical protein